MHVLVITGAFAFLQTTRCRRSRWRTSTTASCGPLRSTTSGLSCPVSTVVLLLERHQAALINTLMYLVFIWGFKAFDIFRDIQTKCKKARSTSAQNRRTRPCDSDAKRRKRITQTPSSSRKTSSSPKSSAVMSEVRIKSMHVVL